MSSVEEPARHDEPAWSPEWRDHTDSQVEDRLALPGVRHLTVDPPAPAASLLDAARTLSTIDPAVLSPDQRLGVLDALESVDRIVTGTLMRHLIAINDRAELDARFGMTTGAYAEQRHAKNRTVWLTAIRRGRSLATRLPLVFDALCAGNLSRDRAELIANTLNDRNADILAAAQQELLDLSDAEPRYREFAQQLQTLAKLADQNGPEPQPEDSTATVTRSGDHLAIVMNLYGLNAITVDQLITAAVTALRRRWQADIDNNPALVMPTGAQLRQQALVELIIRGAGADVTASKPTVNKLSLIIDADRVDALDPILASVLAGTGTDRFTHYDVHNPSFRFTNPDPAGDQADRSDRAEACEGCGHHHRLPGDAQAQHVLVTTPDGDRLQLSAQQWQLLMCDADISELLLDALGEPVAIRDRGRLADTRMRTALTARDGGCVYPGCDAPAGWCDAHHVIEYSKGGTTAIVNLALLCRHHHGIVHRSGWKMERNAAAGVTNGFFVVTTADGLRLRTQHRTRPRPPQAPPGEPPGRPSVPA
jgi:hypothetical protein